MLSRSMPATIWPPAQGEKLKVDDYEYEIVEMDGRNIGKVRISPTETAAYI